MPNPPSAQQLELWETDTSTDTFQETLFPSFELEALGNGRRPMGMRPVAQHRPAPSDKGRSFADRRPLNILVADDNEINRKVIRVILQKLGYHCVEATNGEEALELYHNGEHDYIFMDVDMPEMDGIEATRAIRDLEKRAEDQGEPALRHAEIIAVTANVSDETRLRCRRAGMNGYLEKPITANIIKSQLLRSWPRIRSRRGK